jgi:SSS family solute:Na+ symporter
MKLASIDLVIIGIFISIVLLIGYIASKRAGKNTSEFFLGGRGMPWWLLGISMVACTFSADTPNLVTGFVREDGVAKNWAWWAFLITGMVTVFIYARLWRRSSLMTDLGFYEIRYKGKAASFLRGFRAIYLGILFNTLIMGSVTLAAIKIGEVMFGLQPWITVVSASLIVVIYSGLGGLRGVVWADFFQYTIAMTGAVLAAIVAVKQPEVQAIGGLQGVLHQLGDRASFLPDMTNPSVYIPLLIIPLAVQWWAVWYPGAEPGGGGYIAQKMLSAKNEKNAIGATLLFNFAHYALRPWPWIIVAMASLIIYPDLDSIRLDFPHLSATYLKDDIAYPVMISKLSKGWLGLVVASLIAAYMSTIGTQLNWGSSYVVNDFYKRFIKPAAPEKELVLVGRITTALLMIIGGTFALTFLNNATQAFDILLLSGAGSGAIFLLRWFWWRINAWTEIITMIVGTVLAVILVFLVPDEAMTTQVLDAFTVKLLIAVSATTLVWIITTFLTKPEKKETLRSFYGLTRPGGPGWRKVVSEAEAEGVDITGHETGKKWEMPQQLLMVFLGLVVIYGLLFAIGSIVYGNLVTGAITGVVAVAATVILFRLLGKLRIDQTGS